MSAAAYSHVPVMLKEVMTYLSPRAGGRFLDATLGAGGYTLALAEAVGPKGQILALDLDEEAIKNAARLIKKKKLSNIILVPKNFKNPALAVKEAFQKNLKFDGLVFDLGLSSAQLADSKRGFSFSGDRPLDMAFGAKSPRSTLDIVNRYSLLELTRIFRDYGQERYAYPIARALVKARASHRLKSTAELVAIITSVVPYRFPKRLHPATKVFQALRMETNGELANLALALPAALKLLKSGGRLVVVSFHSGEDRIVKNFFREAQAAGALKILTKKPLPPTVAEITANFRARSAKLRAAFKL